MSKMVNFGIDLGTTNSLIAKFDKGLSRFSRTPTASGRPFPP